MRQPGEEIRFEGFPHGFSESGDTGVSFPAFSTFVIRLNMGIPLKLGCGLERGKWGMETPGICIRTGIDIYLILGY